MRRARSRLAGGLQRRTARMSWLQRDRITSNLLLRAFCRVHLRSVSVSGEMPDARPVAGSNSGDEDPSMWSQKRIVLPPTPAISFMDCSRMALSSAGVCEYWSAFANGRNLTLPRLTPSMKKGTPSRRRRTRSPAALAPGGPAPRSKPSAAGGVVAAAFAAAGLAGAATAAGLGVAAGAAGVTAGTAAAAAAAAASACVVSSPTPGWAAPRRASSRVVVRASRAAALGTSGRGQGSAAGGAPVARKAARLWPRRARLRPGRRAPH